MMRKSTASDAASHPPFGVQMIFSSDTKKLIPLTPSVSAAQLLHPSKGANAKGCSALQV